MIDGELSELDKYYYSYPSLYIAKRELKLNKYVLWLKWWEKAFGSDHVHPIVFENFVEEDRSVVMRICQVLQVDSSFYKNRTPPTENESFLTHIPALQRLVRDVAPKIPDGWLKEAMRSAYWWIQLKDTKSQNVHDFEHGIQKLKEYFRPWNKKLAQQSDLTLSRWDLTEK